jgi:hypothetical protein
LWVSQVWKILIKNLMLMIHTWYNWWEWQRNSGGRWNFSWKWKKGSIRRLLKPPYKKS